MSHRLFAHRGDRIPLFWRRSRGWSLAALMLVVLMLLASCVTPPVTPPTATPPSETARQPARIQIQVAEEAGSEERKGEYMRPQLSEGSEVPVTYEPLPVADTQPLPEQDTLRLLARLPELVAEEADVRTFRLPAKTLPAPRPGETIAQPFPPEEEVVGPEAPVAAPLKVLRYSPEGDVPLAPYLSITFDQPMVAVTSLADLAAEQVPIKLDPLPEGTWRWVGTKTLMFEPLTRFPMATEYTVTVPKGTTSAVGGKLEETVQWRFATPPPQVTSSYPVDGPHRRDPVMFVAFDQRIDPAAVLKSIQVKAKGRSYPLELVPSQKAKADEAVARLIKSAGEGRWLAFRATEMLPYNTTVTVDVGPSTPSLEGPRVTKAVQGFSFTTYGPLQVVETRCGWGEECPPMTPWLIRFSNPLDVEAFDDTMVRIDPELPGAVVSLSGPAMRIQGRSKGRTTYRVTLGADILDVFGQRLEKEQTVTFQVGSARPMMAVPDGNMVVLDPASRPSYSVFTINYQALKVQAYAVTPKDWPAFQEYLRTASRQTSPPTPPGRRVMDKRTRIESEADALVETTIDLDDLIREGLGHLILVVEPEAGLFESLLRPSWQPVIRIWLQATRIALDAFVDSEEMLAWANSLLDGAPLEGVALYLKPGNRTAITDVEGMATLSLPPSSREESTYLIAEKGNDAAFLPQSTSWWGGRGWRYGSLQDEYRWYVFDDRQMYRPGEQVHLKGWVRRARIARGSEDLTLTGLRGDVSISVMDARGNELLSQQVPLNALGGFDTSFTLPETMNLGYAPIRFALTTAASGVGNSEYHHAIQVQEFRRPEFEVSASTTEGPHFVDGYAISSVEAKYYAGGPLPNADVTWLVTTTPSSYRPPKWDDFVFGIWEPWWRSYREPAWDRSTQATFEGRTDAAGVHRLRIDFEPVDPPRPTSVRAEATVMDVNRQAWTAATQMLVHPADLYVGLRSERAFVEQGDPIKVDAIVTDLDGNAIAGRPIELRAVRLRWVFVKGEWQEQEADEQGCQIVSDEEPVRCTFETPEGGTYRITATITDDSGRPNLTQITRWVSGGKRPTRNRVEEEEASLIPDRERYQPGDTAEILVQSPFVPAEGLLTIRFNGIVHSERFHMDEATYTLRIPITEAHIPNVHVQVDLVGAASRLDSEGKIDERLPKRPAYASGSLNLSVPAYSRTLAIEAIPRDKELEPGGQTVIDVSVKDAQGNPVQGAELAVAVVDEAILALTGYTLPDPIAAFYPRRSAGVGDYHLRSSVLLIDPDKLLEQGALEAPQEALRAMAPAPMAAGRVMETAAVEEREVKKTVEMGLADGEGAAGEPIRVRADFNPLAAFEPAVPTDADGTASIEITLPDNLTRYRVMVVAVAGEKHFGKTDASITARLPLMVRPSPPRFLNFGDKFELPVVLQNQTDAPMDVDIVVQATNLVLTEGNGRRTTVPARDRVEVRFPATTENAGIARFVVGAASGPWADAAQFELPVYTPATTEAFAVYGTIDEGAIAQPVMPPSDVFPQFGGLEISTSSTALQALTDAVLYLTSYPFECSEQLASRILAVAALRDVLSAFDAAGLPSPEAMDRAVKRDIERLQGLQNADGGFPVWRRGQESWPFHSIHVAHALARAREKDYAVPEEMVARVLEYLRRIESHYPSWYSQRTRNVLTTYALYVRTQFGDVDLPRTRRLMSEAGLQNLPFEAIGWLLNIMADDPQSASQVAEIRRYLENHVTETAGTAHFATFYREEEGYVLLASNRRADGIILEALIKAEPKSDLIPKVVRGLLAHRKRGRWGNTQENVFILLALDRYFNTYEAQTPDFVARVWLGDQYVAGFEFVGRTTDYQTVEVPMSFLMEQEGTHNLILSKEGEGRLYYRLGMRYAPTDLELAPLEQGFAVQRTYEAVDDPADVYQDERGVWHVKAGARVRVKLRMVAPTMRYHVALVDPMPAGFEALNPALAVTGSLPTDPEDKSSRYWWWHWTWYEHQNLRDERAEAFASLVWDGIHTYSYVVRATTPGKFVVPPPKAEEMYSPEVFGRGGTDRVIVEAAN